MLWQLLAHLWGDYILQSHWMAVNKSKRSWPCFLHVLFYSACFLPLKPSLGALLVIGGTHFIIDRFPVIVRALIWLKNTQCPADWDVPFKWCQLTGYYDPECPPSGLVFGDPNTKKFPHELERPIWLRVWLFIFTDNILHITINAAALYWL